MLKSNDKLLGKISAVIVYLTCVGAAWAQTGLWVEQAKLRPSDVKRRDWFGQPAFIDGDHAIIGESVDNDKGDYAGAAYIFKRDGTNWVQQVKLTISDANDKDYFGWDVSISGDYAVVGAGGEDDNGPDSGSAYVFKRNGAEWVQQQKLTPSDANANDWFGSRVAIKDDYCIVGAWSDDDNGNRSGSAYVFNFNGTRWVQQAKLTASDGEPNDMFGYSISIDGEYAILGAMRDALWTGSAYIFKRNGTDWVQQQKLTAPDANAGDRFGWDVSIDGDYAIVGAHGDDANATTEPAYAHVCKKGEGTVRVKVGDAGGDFGSAYIFKRNETVWGLQQKIMAADANSGDYFGTSISISGDYVIVGASGDEDNGTQSGSAYIFKHSGTDWVQQHKLTASDGSANKFFGGDVSISGNYAIVGGYTDAAYIFNRSFATAKFPD